MVTIDGTTASPPPPGNGGPSATIEDLDSISLRAGDDYGGNRGLAIELTGSVDLAGKNLIIAAYRDDLLQFSLSAAILGVVGSQYATFTPAGSESAKWFPALYDALVRVEHSEGAEETIWTGPLRVTAFPTPPASA